jgi:hypothetical protein
VAKGALNKATCLLAAGKKELAKGSYLDCLLGVLKCNGALEGHSVLKGDSELSTAPLTQPCARVATMQVQVVALLNGALMNSSCAY